MRLYTPMVTILLSSCALLSGCNNGSNNSGNSQEDIMGYTKPQVDESLQMKLLHEGQNSPATNNGPEVYTFNDTAKFGAFWAQHVNDKPAPSVEFKNFMVLAVVDENQATGGYSLHVQKVTKNADEVMVHALRTRPGQNCVNTMIVTKPYVILMVPRIDKPVALSVNVETKDCKA